MASRCIQSAASRSLPLVAASWGATRFQVNDSSAICEKPQFQDAHCVNNRKHTHNTRIITLKLPSDWNKERAPVANVIVRADCGGASESGEGGDGPKMVARPYNPLSAKSGDEITILVKRYGDDAKMGSKLHNLKMGDAVEVKGPNMQWNLPDAGAFKKYIMIAGGTGITPIIQCIEGILRKDLNAVVELYTFNDTPRDILLNRELSDVAMLYTGRLQINHFFGMLPEDMKEGPEKKLMEHWIGYPGKGKLKKVLPKPADDVMVLVCGPAKMVERVAGPKTKDYKQGELAGILKELGFKKEQVWKL